MADSCGKIPDPVFFNAELLNILCFSPANLIIRGYAHPDRLIPLIKVLQQYDHCILEMGGIESCEYLREFLEDCSDHFLSFGRKRLVVMSDIKETHIGTVLNAENVKWVMIIPDPAIKLPRNLRNVYIYTPRTGRIVPELPVKPIFEELAVKTAIRSGERYIDTLARIIGHMFDFSAKIYRAYISSGEKGVIKVVGSAFSSLPPDQKEIILPKVRKMINAYFGIDIPCITTVTITFHRNGDGIISEALPESPEISITTGGRNIDCGVKTETEPSFDSASADGVSSGIKEISPDELRETIKEIAEHPYVADIIKSGKNTNDINPTSSYPVFEREFKIISEYPSIKKTFMGILIKYGRKITESDGTEEFPDAKHTYIILRKSKWKNGIPGNVIKEWISLHFTGLKLRKYSPNPLLERERFIEILGKLGFGRDFINEVFSEKKSGAVHTLTGKDENIISGNEKITPIGIGKDCNTEIPSVNIENTPSNIPGPETDLSDNISDRINYKIKKEKFPPTEIHRLIKNGMITDLRKFNMIMVNGFGTVIKRLKNIRVSFGDNNTETHRYGVFYGSEPAGCTEEP